MAASVALLIPVIGAAPAFADPGALDPTFSRNGKVVTQFKNRYGGATDVAVQADGRVISVGKMQVNHSIAADFAVVRYLSDGSPDMSFSGNGKLTTDFFGRYDGAVAVAIHDNGKIVVVGNSTDAVAVARYRPDGGLDTSFSGDGRLIVNLPSTFDAAADVALQPDGRIVIVGTGDSDWWLLRLTRGGRLDNSFGDKGRVTTDFAGGFDRAFAVTVRDGVIVAGGYAAVSDQNGVDFAVARYLSDGTLDSGFGDDGLVTTDFLGFADQAEDVTIEPDGQVVATGAAFESPGDLDQSSDFGLVRYDTDGDVDEEFAQGGKVRIDFGSYDDEAHSVAIQTDGAIVMAGDYAGDTGLDSAVARYTDQGQPDDAFGSDGLVTTDVSGGTDEMTGLALDGQQRILVAGTSCAGGVACPTFGFSLVRYVAD